MMKQLYTTDDVRELSSGIRKFAALCVALVVIAVGAGVASCFFITDANANMLKIINIVFSSACGCTALYFLLNSVIPAHAKKNYAEKMLNSTSKTVRGRVTDKGKRITTVKYKDLAELRLNDEEGKETVLYWDMEKGEPDFVGHIVEFRVVNNKIVGYGDAQ